MFKKSIVPKNRYAWFLDVYGKTEIRPHNFYTRTYYAVSLSLKYTPNIKAVEKLLRDLPEFKALWEVDYEGDSATKHLYNPKKDVFLSYETGHEGYFTLKGWNKAGLLLLKQFISDKLKQEDTAKFRILEKREMEGISYSEFAYPKKYLKISIPMLYGDKLGEVFNSYKEQLQESNSSLSILSGPPGVGKTSFIRYLGIQLAKQADFYFIPSKYFSLLDDPSFVSFWANIRSNNKSSVVVLEDAENIMMKREVDNQSLVSSLLNLTDGLFGDALKLHFICTVNCELEDLDPAIKRPGRLKNYTHFPKISPERAREIAKEFSKDIPAKDEYTLAEIFNNDVLVQKASPKVGF